MSGAEFAASRARGAAWRPSPIFPSAVRSRSERHIARLAQQPPIRVYDIQSPSAVFSTCRRLGLVFDQQADIAGKNALSGGTKLTNLFEELPDLLARTDLLRMIRREDHARFLQFPQGCAHGAHGNLKLVEGSNPSPRNQWPLVTPESGLSFSGRRCVKEWRCSVEITPGLMKTLPAHFQSGHCRECRWPLPGSSRHLSQRPRRADGNTR